MKKIIFSIAFLIAVLGSSFSYAADNDAIAKLSFSRDFPQSKNVEWTKLDNGVYRAKFIFNDEAVEAYYSEDGESLGTVRSISKSQLPVYIVTNLEKKYPGARLFSIFEHNKNSGAEYYIVLAAKRGTMVVKAISSGDISVFKK